MLKSALHRESCECFYTHAGMFVRQIVCQSDVRSSELTEQTAHGGLMPSDQLTESVLVVIDKNSRDKVRISQLHGRRLR